MRLADPSKSSSEAYREPQMNQDFEEKKTWAAATSQLGRTMINQDKQTVQDKTPLFRQAAARRTSRVSEQDLILADEPSAWDVRVIFGLFKSLPKRPTIPRV